MWPVVGGPRPAADGPGQHLDRLRQPRAPLRRPVMVASVRTRSPSTAIPAVRLGPRHGVAAPHSGRPRAGPRHHLKAERHERPTSTPGQSRSDHDLGRVAGIAGDGSRSRATPTTRSTIRSRASTRPSAAITHTSWWRSAESIRTNNTANSLLLWTLGPGPEKGCGNLTEQCSTSAPIRPAVCLLAKPAGARS